MEAITARGFGPGLPPEGASVVVRLMTDGLRVEGWPGVDDVGKADLVVRRQGAGLVLEWDSAEGRRALSIDANAAAPSGRKRPDGAAALADWLPRRGTGHDGATRRWLWAALFVVFGLPLLLLAVFFGFRARIVDAAVAAIPVAREQALADELWKLQQARLKLVEGTPANRFVAETGARLVAAKPTPYTYRFHIADDKSVNAFAMPAGYIVVHRGLLAKAASAEEVAGVLAHEIEHVEQRHSLRGMVQAVGFQALWLALTGDIGGGLAGEGARQLAGLHFSREQESAADTGGFARLVAARIDPRGMASFFETLAKEPAAVPELLSSHPASAERAATLKVLFKDAPDFPPLIVDWKAIQSGMAAATP